jgi:ribosomal protein S18 acetylase RimI-like enzyme
MKLNKEDAAELIAIHCLAFPGFFLTDLGKDVLLVFYTALIQDKSTIVWGLKNDQKIIGFFVASTTPKGLYTKIFLNNISRFIVPLTISFIKNISFLKKMIISFNSSNSLDVTSTYPSSLLSICVSPAYAGKGVGKMLLNKLENELKLQNQIGYYLTTDSDKNDATNKFYLNFGFKLYGSYAQGKRVMNIYVKDIK